jgi:hypothetical protein
MCYEIKKRPLCGLSASIQSCNCLGTDSMWAVACDNQNCFITIETRNKRSHEDALRRKIEELEQQLAERKQEVDELTRILIRCNDVIQRMDRILDADQQYWESLLTTGCGEEK